MVTVAGVAMGTLGYMAPEALTDGGVDERANIFSIGVMAVETLVGTRPFRGFDAARDPRSAPGKRVSLAGRIR
jgi:serine/threonine protein kinase